MVPAVMHYISISLPYSTLFVVLFSALGAYILVRLAGRLLEMLPG